MKSIDLTLYHYTNASGAMGIFQGKSLWLNPHEGMNDKKEFLHAIDLLGRYLDGYIEQYFNITRSRSLKLADLVIGKISRCEFYILSFTEEPDLLSQWRAYGNSNGSVSIGLNVNELISGARSFQFHDVGASRFFFFDKCEYSEDRQKSAIEDAVKDASNESLHVGYDDDDVHIYHLYVSLMRRIPFFKTAGFSEEREWRVALLFSDKPARDGILGLKTEEDGRVNKIFKLMLRSSDKGLINYVSWDISDVFTRAIKRAIIGPTDYAELNTKAYHVLLQKTGVKAEVESSKISFRR